MSQPSQSEIPKSLTRVLIYGNSLAANQAALALSEALNERIEIVLVNSQQGACKSDILYGGVSPPEAYDTHLSLKLSEPELLLNTNTSFSFGSHYQSWGLHKQSWVQCYHLPFTTPAGVDFHHIVTKHKAQLSDYLISAQAALEGKFAHPPLQDSSSALSRAEYGYHFDHQLFNSLLAQKVAFSRVKVVNSTLKKIEINKQSIQALVLESGETITADLYIDASGIDASLLSHLCEEFISTREVSVKYVEKATENVGAPCRKIVASADGWQATTPLRGKNSVLTLTLPKEESTKSSEPDENNNSVHFASVALGYRRFGWVGNCVGLGHAACVIDPVSPAPMKLLSLDLSRLLELIPIDTNMQMERQEYNRRFTNDVTHANLFNKALYDCRLQLKDSNEALLETVDQETDFWRSAEETGKSDLLNRKITQFLHRGILVSYDLEPFNQQDWTILHNGMNRRPAKFDRLAEQVDQEKMQSSLDALQAGIKQLCHVCQCTTYI